MDKITGLYEYHDQQTYGPPKKKGCYLVYRNCRGEEYMELLCFDGRFWVTGLHDDPEAFIQGWRNLPPREA